jgi:hypothetical protein
VTPEGSAFFEAFAASHPAQVLIKVFTASDPAPQGEIDPAIDRVLQAYKRTLIGDHNLKSIRHCRTPDVDACSPAECQRTAGAGR